MIKKTLMTLNDNDIIVAQKEATPVAGLAMATSLQAGEDATTCASKACCDSYGGKWDGAAKGGLGACSDQGSGDWD